MIGKSRVSRWIHTYAVGIREESLGSEKMWGTVVSSLLAASGYIHQRFIAVPDYIVGITSVVVYEINYKSLVDASGISGIGADEE